MKQSEIWEDFRVLVECMSILCETTVILLGGSGIMFSIS